MANVIQNNEGEWVLRVEWSIDDVRQYIEDNELDELSSLTDNDCLNILRIMAYDHDAEIGINWDCIGSALDFYSRSISSNTPMYAHGVKLEVGV